MDLLPDLSEPVEQNINENISDAEPMDTIEEQEEEVLEEEQLPEVKEKEKIQVEEVFKKAEQLQAETPVIKKVKKTRTMTPKAKESLAKARLKAVETRKKNAQLRREGKLKTPTQMKEDKLKQEEDKKKPVINNITHETNNITNNITHEDIEKISLAATQKALDNYEQVRKARKEAKKKKKEEENQRTIVKQKIETAMGINHPNFFDHCF